MTDHDDHKPEPWFWEAGSEHCPHGPEPDQMTAAWDEWAAHHTGSPQEIFVCPDAPLGDCCPACSDEHGDFVRWADCPASAQPAPG